MNEKNREVVTWWKGLQFDVSAGIATLDVSRVKRQENELASHSKKRPSVETPPAAPAPASASAPSSTASSAAPAAAPKPRQPPPAKKRKVDTNVSVESPAAPTPPPEPAPAPPPPAPPPAVPNLDVEGPLEHRGKSGATASHTAGITAAPPKDADSELSRAEGQSAAIAPRSQGRKEPGGGAARCVFIRKHCPGQSGSHLISVVPEHVAQLSGEWYPVPSERLNEVPPPSLFSPASALHLVPASPHLPPASPATLAGNLARNPRPHPYLLPSPAFFPATLAPNPRF